VNDYAKAAIVVAALASAAYVTPRLIHLWQQQRIVDALRKPVEGTFDFTKALVELSENYEGGGYV